MLRVRHSGRDGDRSTGALIAPVSPSSRPRQREPRLLGRPTSQRAARTEPKHHTVPRVHTPTVCWARHNANAMAALWSAIKGGPNHHQQQAASHDANTGASPSAAVVAGSVPVASASRPPSSSRILVGTPPQSLPRSPSSIEARGESTSRHRPASCFLQFLCWRRVPATKPSLDTSRLVVWLSEMRSRHSRLDGVHCAHGPIRGNNCPSGLGSHGS